MCILAVYYAVVYINDSILSIQIYTNQSGWGPLHTKQKQNNYSLKQMKLMLNSDH